MLNCFLWKWTYKFEALLGSGPAASMLTPYVFCWMFVGAASFNLFTEESVTAVLGGNVSLPCSFSVPVVAVYWYKHDFTGASDDETSLVARDYRGFTDPVPDFERFGIGADYRLLIHDVSVLDETTYSCLVVPHQFVDQRGYTDLSVIALANPQVPMIPSCETNEPGRCTYIIGEDEEGVTLECNVYNARPPANVTWMSSDGSVRNNTKHQIYEKDGVFNISSQLWVSIEEIGDTFVCVATGESINGTSTLVATIKYSTDIGLSSGGTAGIATSLVFFVIIVVLIVAYNLRKKKRKEPLSTDLEEQVLILVPPKQGMQQLTETDIFDVTHETNLDHGQLKNLLTELHIEAADTLTEKDRNAPASDLKFHAFNVLCVWRKTEGINATRGTLRNALHKCGYSEALEILDERWGLNSRDESGTESLSHDLIKMCRDDFQRRYRKDFCMIRSDPLDPDSVKQIKDIYINLDLEEENNKKNMPLEYKNLFKIKINGQFPTRIMFQGEAGSGKTTLCAKIAWDWVNGSPDVPNYVWVLVVPLREARQNRIGRFVKSYLSENNPTTASQIIEYIRSNPENVLIVCDGFDESHVEVVQKRIVASESVSILEAASAGQSKERAESVMNKGRGDIALVNILRSDELSRCPVLVTSRPYKATEIRWNSVLRRRYTFIRVQGFSWENTEAYVRKYFADSVATADQLIYVIKGNGIVYEHMAPYPIYISMICLMWKELDYRQKDRFRSLRTFSEIFDCIFTFLEGHYAQKETTDLDEASVETALSDISEYLKPVAKIALIGLQERNLIFSEGDFERYSESVEVACKVGVLSREKNMTSILPIHGNRSRYLQSKIFFPHKLFQEYMAGKHLASMYDSDGDEFNKLIDDVVLPRKEEFRYLLYFTVSRDKTVANGVIQRMILRFKPDFSDETGMTNRRERDFLVDVSLESQDPETAKMVRPIALNSEVHIGLETTAHTIAGFEFIGMISNAATLFVSRECGDSVGLSIDVAEIICTASSLDYVKLGVVSFHDNFYAVLAEKGWKSSVRRLWIGTVKSITPDSSCQLVRALCSMEKLTILTLEGGVGEERFFSRLSTSASNLYVQTLNLQGLQFPTADSSKYLAQSLCSMPKLSSLAIHWMTHMEEFCSSLKTNASSLQVRTLSLHSIDLPTLTSSENLVESLCSMPHLNDLSIQDTDVTEKFCTVMKAKGASIKVAILKLKGIEFPSPVSLEYLAVSLCFMPNLTDLSIRTMDEIEDLLSTLKDVATSIQGSFSKISEGKFNFNGKAQMDRESFLKTLNDGANP